MQPLTRRRFCAAVASTLAVAGCGAAAVPPTPTIIAPINLPTATAAPVAGKLLITTQGNFFDFDLATLRETQLTHFPQDSFAASPSLSPDRSKVAYSFYVLPKNESDLGGSDLSLMDVTGADPRVVRAHGTPGVSFEEPCWTSDGSGILCTQRTTVYNQGNYQGVKVQVVRIGLDGSGPAAVVADAQSPATSPDGKHLAYLTVDQQGATSKLWIGAASGAGAKDLLGTQNFTYIRAPRFSADSTRIAFGAVGGPSVATPAKSSGLVSPLALLRPAVAEAHGIAWEIWTVAPDGSDLRRLTHVQEDSPIPAWSPDGKWVAFAGEVGLYLVDAEGHQTLRLSTKTSGGGLAWL